MLNIEILQSLRSFRMTYFIKFGELLHSIYDVNSSGICASLMISVIRSDSAKFFAHVAVHTEQSAHGFFSRDRLVSNACAW